MTFLTQIRDNYKSAPLGVLQAEKSSQKSSKNIFKTKSPKRSLEKNLSKLADTLKRRSNQKPKKVETIDTCPFCNERVYMAERYGHEGFWYHRRCFKCEKCGDQIISHTTTYANNDYREINGKYYHIHCAPEIDENSSETMSKLTEPEIQQKVDDIIVKTNVPVPKPRAKSRAKPVKRAETTRPLGATSYQEYIKSLGTSSRTSNSSLKNDPIPADISSKNSNVASNSSSNSDRKSSGLTVPDGPEPRISNSSSKNEFKTSNSSSKTGPRISNSYAQNGLHSVTNDSSKNSKYSGLSKSSRSGLSETGLTDKSSLILSDGSSSRSSSAPKPKERVKSLTPRSRPVSTSISIDLQSPSNNTSKGANRVISPTARFP